MSYKYFINRECEYFPCHNGIPIDRFNCLFCYCPLYLIEDCGGNFKVLSSGIKDCSRCMIPHKRENYFLIIDKLKEATGGKK